MLALLLAARVLILTAGDAPPSERFVETLRIQLAGIAAVNQRGAAEGATLPDKTDNAVKLVRSEGASLAVWVEPGVPSDSKAAFVLYVVGEREGRVLVEVFEVEGTAGPALDRAIAIKVGEVLDAILAPPAVTLGAGDWIGTVGDTRAKTKEPLLFVAPLLRATFGLDAPATQTSIGGAITFDYRWRGIVLEYGFSLSRATGFVTRAAVGEVYVGEWSYAGVGRAFTEFGRFKLGGGIALTDRRLEAEGTTVLGATGVAKLTLLDVNISAESRLALGRGYDLRAAVGMAISDRRRTLSVNDIEVVDLGRHRPFVEISLVIPVR